MLRFPHGFALSGVACVLVVGLGLGAAASLSEAQPGTMHNCPPAGKWSIAVWDGESGAAAGDALATCGADAVAAAYSLDAQTGAWSRWFAGEPDVSNLPPLSDMQGVLALGSAQVQASPIAGLPNPAAVYCVELGYEWSIVETPEGQAGVCVFPDDTQCDEWSFFEGECGQSWATETEGTMHGCPPAGRWSLAVWDGAGGTTAGDALATCGADAVQAAYSLDAQTGAWSRWFAGKPDVSNLAPLSNMQGVLALGSAAGGQTPEPLSGWWESTWTGDGGQLGLSYAEVSGGLSEIIHVGSTYSSAGDLVEGSEVRELEG
ncbi:MAG TPA: DUF333 domain-containing protein, partial [Dehalococcoidia bacterium]|nr:DUF333 domain-containing protein [Dehalococcoidia bacterium]